MEYTQAEILQTIAMTEMEHLDIRTVTFVETRGIGNFLPVVSKASASLDLPGTEPIEIDADHMSICKPSSEEDLIYRRVELFCAELLGLDR